MTLTELMKDRTPSTDFEGFVTNDDFVLAVDIGTTPATHPSEYTVAQMGVAGLDAQLNPVTQDKQYIRAGQTTIKTGTQRTFKITGDRYIGDDFQDHCFSHGVKYGTGNNVVVPYVYFNVLNGVGEQGTASIIVNSDASGNAGESSGVDIDVKKAGAMPVEYTYSPKSAE